MKIVIVGCVWWLLPVIPAFENLGQKDQEFKTVVGYRVNSRSDPKRGWR